MPKTAKKINKKTFLGLAVVFFIIIFAAGIFAPTVSHRAEEIIAGMFGELYAGTWSFMNGSVGIGTTNPQKELDVNGSINVTKDLCLSNDCRDTWPSGVEGMIVELPKGSHSLGASYASLQTGHIYIPSGASQYQLRATGGGNGISGTWQMRFTLGGHTSSTGTFGQYQNSQTMTLSQSGISGWVNYSIDARRTSGSTNFVMAVYNAGLAITI